MASKATKALSAFLSLLALWLASLNQLSSIPKRLHPFIQLFPIWLVFLVGAAALVNVGYHLVTFRECPEAYVELQREIKDAKSQLSSKGFKFQ